MKLNIYEVSHLLSKQNVIANGMFKDNKTDDFTKYLNLFINIVDGKVNNDQEARALLGYKNGSTSFKKFKERYTFKLLDYIIISEKLNLSVENKFREYYRLTKLFTVARILINKHYKKDAIELFEYIGQKASKYDFLDLLLFTYRELKKHYAYINPNTKEFNKYTEKVNTVMNQLKREVELENIYDSHSHNFLFNKIADNEAQYKERILKEVIALRDDIKEEDTFNYKFKSLELISFGYNINNQLHESIEISKQMAELAVKHVSASKFELYTAYNEILTSYLKMKKFDEAYKYLDKILEMFTFKAHNYFRFKGIEFSIYIVTNEIEKAFTLTQNILKEKNLKSSKVLHEEWKIREAFMNIYVESGAIANDILQKNNYKSFRLNRFVNDIEKYAKDKRGTNISLQVVQLMHFLVRKEYGKISDRLDALTQYTYRYLRKGESLRSNCFIKMLLRLPEAEYHPLRTERYVIRYLKKLEENPYEITLKAIEVEIVPYEQLWGVIMKVLNTNLVKKLS